MAPKRNNPGPQQVKYSIGQASQIGLLLGERLPITPPPGAEQLNGTEDVA